MPAKPWPRVLPDGTVVHKQHGRDGAAIPLWFVSSASVAGAFRQVQFCSDGRARWWLCSCPGGGCGELRMGSQFGRSCRHVKAVTAAEQDDGYAPRPSAPANITALTE